MNAELHKRYTDCVYFLASPLTCKKGIECEYRHSEVARLNPRECWYWLSGNCFNPSCAFRHPPLDTGEASEPAPSSVPVKKTNVPCFYYFNGYCNKAEMCSFLHVTENEGHGGKPVKAQPSANPEAVHFKNNAFPGSDLGLAPTTTRKVEDDTKVRPKEGFQRPALAEEQRRSSSPQIFVSEDEETAAMRPYSLPPAAGLVRGTSYARENLGSDDLEEINEGDVDQEELDEEEIEREERWESSPGFDVLVDGEEENLDSDGAQLYITAIDRRRELHSHFSGYVFENPVEYNPNYPEMECRFVSERLHRYEHNVDEDLFGHMQNGPPVRMTPMPLGFDNHTGLDLREQLRRRRLIDGRSFPRFSRIHESSRMISRIRERPWRNGMGHNQRRGRLASEVGRYGIELFGRNGIKSASRNGFPRHSKRHRSKKQHKEEKKRAKKQRVSSEVSKEQSTREHEEFSGPKTLAQIKDEKRKAQENGDSPGTSGRKRSTDFEGPRALNEILKDKGKLL